MMFPAQNSAPDEARPLQNFDMFRDSVQREAIAFCKLRHLCFSRTGKMTHHMPSSPMAETEKQQVEVVFQIFTHAGEYKFWHVFRQDMPFTLYIRDVTVKPGDNASIRAANGGLWTPAATKAAVRPGRPWPNRFEVSATEGGLTALPRTSLQFLDAGVRHTVLFPGCFLRRPLIVS